MGYQIIKKTGSINFGNCLFFYSREATSLLAFGDCCEVVDLYKWGYFYVISKKIEYREPSAI